MAKAPNTRRGITLGPRAESAAALDLLNAQPAASISLPSDQTHHPAGATPEILPNRLIELDRMNADLDRRWRSQAEQLQEQSRQLEQQRDQITLQTRQLQALEQRRQRSGRLGILLALLVISGVGALGFHTWPQVQHLAGHLNRVSMGADQAAPELLAVRGQLTSLTSELGQMGSAMTSLQEDVSGVRSDLGALRQSVDTLPARSGTVQANAHGAAHPSPGNATTMANPYRGMRPMMPW